MVYIKYKCTLAVISNQTKVNNQVKCLTIRHDETHFITNCIIRRGRMVNKYLNFHVTFDKHSVLWSDHFSMK